MFDKILTQYEADALIKQDKVPTDNRLIDLPDFGGSIAIKLQSQDMQENFILNYRRSKIKLSKVNHHLRAPHKTDLVRLDVGGPPHRNPDGKEIGPNHLHLYREGYDLKFAYDVPKTDFPNLKNIRKTLEDFLRYCHVVKQPNFNSQLNLNI